MLVLAIREAARDAWMRERSGREDEARAALGVLLAPFDVGLLLTVDTQVTDTYTMFIFHDLDDDVYLAVRSRGAGWEAHAVVDEGGWTRVGERVESLAQLHEILPPADEAAPEPEPTIYPAWVQPTGAHDAYARADVVTHVGKVWESTVDGNVWEPGVSSWREKVTT